VADRSCSIPSFVAAGGFPVTEFLWRLQHDIPEHRGEVQRTHLGVDEPAGADGFIAFEAYSPELNPIELVWLYLKSHYLPNRVYADHDALYEAGIDAWNRFADDPKLVSSLCHAAWVESAQLN